MTIKPQYYSPVPMPRVPASLPDFRPKVLNGEFYNASGAGISGLGDKIGAENVLRDGLFSDTMLKALDAVSGYQLQAEYIEQQAIIDPESVDVHEIADAEARATMSLNITRTILNRIVQAWKDVINTR
ncbi:MAG: flagellar hook-basal body complex protein FliE [Spirochaetaceae bacterium]|jgi:flagellar hook-basal body complex protein FliE|nr:flagellar hook-basal body complex protein FliE [Spirochaetaceae bacterium]